MGKLIVGFLVVIPLLTVERRTEHGYLLADQIFARSPSNGLTPIKYIEYNDYIAKNCR